jgi:hypothetical protein
MPARATITSFTLLTIKYKYLKDKHHFPNAKVKWNNKTSSIEIKRQGHNWTLIKAL